jgi:transcriptional regulator with XRE-family HTH domain
VTGVGEWTGAEVRLLRVARRMSVREFAHHLGVSDRMVSKWESGGDGIRPRPVNQAALDESLRQSTPLERSRFDAALSRTTDDGDDSRGPIRWSLIIDMPPEDVELARTIAAAVRSVLAHSRPRIQ